GRPGPRRRSSAPTPPRSPTRRPATTPCCGCCSTVPSLSASSETNLSTEITMLDRFEMNRRALLKLSAAGVLGTSVSGWFGTLAAQAAAAEKQAGKSKACILLWMNGGPAQSHTFDLKDGGEYKAIDTSVAGIKISEYLPTVAKQMEHMAILRSMSTGEAS